MFNGCFNNTSAKDSDSLSSSNSMTWRIKIVAIEMSNFEAIFTFKRLLVILRFAKQTTSRLPAGSKYRALAAYYRIRV